MQVNSDCGNNNIVNNQTVDTDNMLSKTTQIDANNKPVQNIDQYSLNQQNFENTTEIKNKQNDEDISNMLNHLLSMSKDFFKKAQSGGDACICGGSSNATINKNSVTNLKNPSSKSIASAFSSRSPGSSARSPRNHSIRSPKTSTQELLNSKIAATKLIQDRRKPLSAKKLIDESNEQQKVRNISLHTHIQVSIDCVFIY